MASQISPAVTFNSRCAHSLLSFLQSFQRRHKPPSVNSVLLFALAPSPATPPEVLSNITSTLTRLYPKHVGCISAPLPYQYSDPRMFTGPNPCTLAYAFVNGVSFRSSILGRAEAQVGRWHAARRRGLRGAEDANGAMRVGIEDPQIITASDGRVNLEDAWDRSTNPVTCLVSSRHGDNLDSGMLPDALQNLDPSAIDTILYFSDKAPEGLETVLESAFRQSNKLSLIASSTPFITGRPVTLFHNGSILSNGAVGIALSSSPSSPPVVELSFPPLVALSTNLNVMSSEGNLILSLDSGNPTRLLLSAVQKHSLSSSHTTWVGKEDEFYVGVIDPSSQEVSQLHRINAGDPSRGSLALDAACAPKEGSIVRLYHLPRDPVPDTPTYNPDTTRNNISLFVVPEMNPAANFGEDTADDPVADGTIILNGFLAASENGFTLSHGTQGPWKCVAPGGRAGLSWSLHPTSMY